MVLHILALLGLEVPYIGHCSSNDYTARDLAYRRFAKIYSGHLQSEHIPAGPGSSMQYLYHLSFRRNFTCYLNGLFDL